MSTSVLLLGGTGFVGRSWLASLNGQLQTCDGIEITWWTDSRVGDYRFIDDLHKLMGHAQPDVVLQLAWAAGGIPQYEHSEDNRLWITFTEQIARASQSHGAWFVGIGTGAEVNRSETSTYVESKRETFDRLSGIFGEHGFTWLRPHWIFDISSRRPRVLHQALEAQDRGALFHPKTPSHFHDFVQVQDVSNALSLAVMHKLRGIHDIATGQSRSVWWFLKTCGVALREFPVDRTTSEHTRMTLPAPKNEVLKGVGWKPRHTREFFGS